ncbi:Blp family class II bacteriocin [Staphylococcus chromogenes]|uniref:Blp family class II bacteriocin n=1 Tax=Staphylococcus chromogenes TaxID=46126 RepID=UPI0028885AE8|nr:Blp family class II bacteriocin [Staphylococcus chromogenes]MDT0715534.1 Blp family class II bacteriocin [Staphylococcus chromogenes]
MRKLTNSEVKSISGGSAGQIANCVGRYTAGGVLGGMAGIPLGPVGVAAGAGAGAYASTPDSCRNAK